MLSFLKKAYMERKRSVPIKNRSFSVEITEIFGHRNQSVQLTESRIL